MTRVLIVEDETTLSHILKDTLETMEFEVALASDGAEGLELYRIWSPDIIVSDIMMPVMSGLEMVQQIRIQDKQTPVLMLTAKTQVNDVVEGFGAGANDYLRKPFAIPELVVRIRALLGRATLMANKQTDELKAGHFILNTNNNNLTDTVTGQCATIPNREAAILKELILNVNDIVPTKRILADLWGNDDFFSSRSLSVLMTRLRHRLAPDSTISIINIRGEGYKLTTGEATSTL